MICAFAGTRDGRDWVLDKLAQGEKLVVSVATEYGASLYPVHEGLKVVCGRKNKEEMARFIKEFQVDSVVDITHPYAVEVSKNIRWICDEMKIPYLRIQRERAITEKLSHSVRCFDSYPDLVEYLENTQGNIFWTIGSNALDQVMSRELKTRSYVRVLPTSSVLQKCEGLGLDAGQILAIQGPFSEDMNRVMYKDCKIRHMVTKDGGKTGGVMEKIQPALEMGIQVLVYNRPKEK